MANLIWKLSQNAAGEAARCLSAAGSLKGSKVRVGRPPNSISPRIFRMICSRSRISRPPLLGWLSANALPTRMVLLNPFHFSSQSHEQMDDVQSRFQLSHRAHAQDQKHLVWLACHCFTETYALCAQCWCATLFRKSLHFWNRHRPLSHEVIG